MECTVQSKVCKSCGLEKDLSLYNKRGGGFGQTQALCRTCDRLMKKAEVRAARKNGFAHKQWRLYYHNGGITKQERARLIKIEFDKLKLENNIVNVDIYTIAPMSKENREYFNSKIKPAKAKIVDDVELNNIRKEQKEQLDELNNKQCKIERGYLYILTNPCKEWAGCVKIGKALDYETRTHTYQTSCPFRDFELHYKSQVFPNRRKVEAELKRILKPIAIYENIDDHDWYFISIEEVIKIIKMLESIYIK